MAQGFVIEEQSPYQATEIWVKGHPERGVMGGVKIKDRSHFPVTAYRCTRCGYLEHYAQ